MTIRAMGPMAGLGWLTRALNVGRNSPGAVFGGAILMVLVTLAAAVAATMVQFALVAMIGTSLTTMIVGTVLTSLIVLVPLTMMMVGFFRLLHKVESGSGARVLDVFSGFGDVTTSLRAIGLLLLLAIVQNLILGAILMTFAGGFLQWYMQLIQASMAGAGTDPALLAQLPAGMGIASVAMLLTGLVFFGVQSISLCQVALRGRGVFSALGDGFVGAFKNLLPLLMFVIACLVAAVLLVIALVLLALVIGLLAKLAGAWLAVVLAIPLYILGTLAVYVVMFGAMYHLWRDVCDGAESGSGPVAAEAVIA